MKHGMISVIVMFLIVGGLLPGSATAASATEKKVMIAIGLEPMHLDPSLAAAGSDNIVVENWGEFLIQREPNGDLTPGLATSWKWSPDGKSIEFTLRQGVTFHSGDPLTMRDVEFSFERARTKNPVLKTRLKLMNRLEVIDANRFKIHFKTPDVTFVPLRAAAMIVSKSYYDRVGEDTFTKVPSGTGPYKFVKYADGEYVDLERFDRYWGKKGSVKEARMLFVPEDNTRIAKLQAGEVDLIQGVPFNLAKSVQESPRTKTVTLALHHPSRAVMFTTRNPSKPWYKQKVRLAMAYAIDTNAIVKNLLHGIPNHWPWLAPNELGYDKSVTNYPYDPKKAKGLLAEAGYPNGFDLKFYWPISGRVPMSGEVAQAIAAYFEAVGIRTKLEGQELETFYATRRAGKEPTSDYVGYISGGLPGAPDPTYNYDLYFSTDGAFSTYTNPELDKLNAEARATIDDKKRAALIRKIVQGMKEDVPCIPIFDNVAIYAMQKNVNFIPTLKYNMELVLVKDIAVQ